jgi:hypothetical protein
LAGIRVHFLPDMQDRAAKAMDRILGEVRAGSA